MSGSNHRGAPSYRPHPPFGGLARPLDPRLASLGAVPGSRTDGLRRGIERALPDRPFTIELWDGRASRRPVTGRRS